MKHRISEAGSVSDTGGPYNELFSVTIVFNTRTKIWPQAPGGSRKQ